MNLDIFGTDEPPAGWRAITIGRLAFQLEEGAIRRVCVGGVEVLRGIAFLVRDAAWGTVPITLDGLTVEQDGDIARIAYRAVAALPEGTVAWEARIEADPSGLAFTVVGAATADLLVNRVGFVALHPLDGVAGRDMGVEHTDGAHEIVAIPWAISPDQPVFDIAALTHAPCPGLTARVEFQGGPFEMEDQRNWTDASFKTYVRPLAWPRPFRLPAGEPVTQSVRLRIAGDARLSPAPALSTDFVPGAVDGAMPGIAVAIEHADDMALLAALAPQHLLLRVDGADPGAVAAGVAGARVAGSLGTRLALDIVINGRDPARELAALAASGVQPASVIAIARRDLRSRPSDTVPAGEATASAIARAARAAFPGAAVGGGTRANFTELNRNRPATADIDIISHASSAIVHAADDRSVMQTLEALPHVIASAHALAPNAAYWLGPCTLGMADNPYGAATADNPLGRRVPGARRDPRHAALFGAAWAVGMLAAAAEGGVAVLSLGYVTGDLGLLSAGGAPTPLGCIVRVAAGAAGCPHRSLKPLPGLAAIAWDGLREAGMLIANLTPEPRPAPESTCGGARVLQRTVAGWRWVRPDDGAPVLEPYGVAWFSTQHSYG